MFQATPTDHRRCFSINPREKTYCTLKEYVPETLKVTVLVFLSLSRVKLAEETVEGVIDTLASPDELV